MALAAKGLSNKESAHMPWHVVCENFRRLGPVGTRD
jgi:hypothetical protein